MKKVCKSFVLIVGFVVFAVMANAVSTQAAPLSPYERAMSRAAVAYKNAVRTSFEASLFAERRWHDAAASANAEWEAALAAAVDLDPVVQETNRAYERVSLEPESESQVIQVQLRTEDMQIAREIAAQTISAQIGDDYNRMLEAGGNNVEPAPVIRNYNWEIGAYGGGVFTSSFDQRFDTALFGGRSALVLTLPNQFRVQFDVEGEATGKYCDGCNGRSYLTYGGHFDWRFNNNIEIGAFGAYQDASQPYRERTTTNHLFGGEARYVTPSWVIGFQAGWFDNDCGPKGIVDAWFWEARTKIAIGQLLHIGPLPSLVLALNLGYASGDFKRTSLWASSSQLGVALQYRVSNTPMTAYVGYDHYENRIESIGKVWDENIVKVGFKLDFSNDPLARFNLEKNNPLPFIVRTNLTY
jgi:hypothetical protein